MPGTDRPTHYETLAVDPRATIGEIREAYRHLARDHHPDRVASTGADGRSMSQINEAYRVLSDPARRAMYDASLRAPRPAGSDRSTVASGETNSAGSSGSAIVRPVTPARIPWRALLVVGAIAVGGLVAVAQFSDPSAPADPDGILRVGSCVSVDSDGLARETSCVGDVTVDLVVASIVPFDADCPPGTVGHQDRQGLGVACVEMPTEIPG